MKTKRYTLEAGRQIYLDGKPLISIGREGGTPPSVADMEARHIVDLLNGALKGALRKPRGGQCTCCTR
jgi:hypothetical protein